MWQVNDDEVKEERDEIKNLPQCMKEKIKYNEALDVW